MSQMQPHEVEMFQDRVELLERRIGSLEKLVVDFSAATGLLHDSAVLAGEIMEGILDKLDILEGNNAEV